MSRDARSTNSPGDWPAVPITRQDSFPRIVVFVAGARARVEAAVHEIRRLYRDRHLIFVCDPVQREWLSVAAGEDIFVVEPPFNPFGFEAAKLRDAIEAAPIEACVLVVANGGFESVRFRIFALRLRTSHFVLLSPMATEIARQVSRFSFVAATGSKLFVRICDKATGWIRSHAPPIDQALDQSLAVGLAWLARVLLRFRSRRAANAGKEVVHVLPTIGMGGVQKQLVLLLKNRSPAYNHRVVVMWSNDQFFGPELAACDVPVYYLNADGTRTTVLKSHERQDWVFKLRPFFAAFHGSFPFCSQIIELSYFLRALEPRPDLVHCWLLFANLAGSIAARLAGVRQVVTSVRNIQSEVEYNYYDPRWQRPLECATVPLANVITANAPAVAADFRKFTAASNEKVVTVPNGVDVAAFRLITPQERLEKRRALGLAPTDLVVGTVARLAKEKDFETFLRAIALARSKLSSLHCLIVGDGPLRARLEAFCASLTLSALVQFLGERKDVGDLIQCYDVFLLTSVIEGMPNAVMESQLIGTPVVATRAGGTVDLIRDGETGLLAPIGDAETLASCVVKILTEQELRNRICRAASEQIRNNYTVEQLVARTENIYRNLLDGNCSIGKHACAE